MELAKDSLFAGRYRLLQERGRGSFGEVWLARDEQLDMDVAVKVYIALDDRGIEDFKKEYKTAYNLNHPNLLHAYHFDICERRPFLVMPFCPSSALSLLGKCDGQTLWRFIADVADGLAYLHSLDVVHHDIKPDNILISEKGSFLITDFGISTKLRSSLRRNSVRSAREEGSSGGSLPYMGPEMFSGKPESVKATDIWAFGVTLYEMVTGDLPFFGQGGVMQLNGAEIPVLPSEDRQLVDLVKACLAKETWDRPTAAAIASQAKARLSGKAPQEPAEKPAKEPSRKTVRQTPEVKGTVPMPEKPSPEEPQVPSAAAEGLLPTAAKAAAILCIPFSLLVGLYAFWGAPYAVGGALLAVLGAVLLLRKEKWGYFLCCAGGLIAAIFLRTDLNPLLLGIGLAVIAGVGWLLLSKPRNAEGRTAWELMGEAAKARRAAGQPRFDKWVYAALAVILAGSVFWGIHSSSDRTAKRQLKAEYASTVKALRNKLNEGGTDLVSVEEMVGMMQKLRSLESSLEKYGNHPDISRQLEPSLNEKREQMSARLWREVESADTEEEKATLLYDGVQYGVGFDSLYYYQVDEMNGILRVSQVVLSDSADNMMQFEIQDGTLKKTTGVDAFTASAVDYLYLEFKPDAFEQVDTKYNKHTFNVKIITPGGRVMTGNNSPSGYTYSYSISEPEDGSVQEGKSLDYDYVSCLGWGNDNKTAFAPGTYHWEVYDRKRRLFRIPVTFK